MIRTGRRAIPAIHRLANRRNPNFDCLSQFLDLEFTTKHEKVGACRSHSSYKRKVGVKSERKEPNRTRIRADAVSLKEARNWIDKILLGLTKLDLPQPSLSPIEISAGSKREEILSILEETRGLVHSLIGSVSRGQLNPSGKHGKELSNLLELALFVCSRVNLPDIPVFGDCQKVLSTLQNWNLDVRSKHYEYAIAVACREDRWQEASDLFWKQINPEAGYNPVDVSVANPMGLYAIARWAQTEKMSVADHVFDAVTQLTMVSPSDQKKYVLAAGTALGHAGEWESAVEYLRTSYSATHMGQPLVASVMQACLLSDRPEEALDVYNEKMSGEESIAEQWQWGGERDVLDPLLRDLAMRSMKARDGIDTLALTIFRQSLEEQVTISLDALLGVLEACEREQNLEGALSVLFYILGNSKKANWIVPGVEMSIVDCDSDVALEYSDGTVAERWLPVMEMILASVMRTCNTKSHFGYSLFCMRLFELHCRKGSDAAAEGSTVPILSILKISDDVLSATMVSLCGLRCYSEAIRLFEAVCASQSQEIQGRKQALPPKSNVVYDYAVSENTRHGTICAGNPWVSADKHMHRLTASLYTIQNDGHDLNDEERSLMQSALASVMHSCTLSHQPGLSLFLFLWTESIVSRGSSEPSARDMVQEHLALKSTVDDMMEFCMGDDAVMAEAIHACKWNKDPAGAVSLFQALLDSKILELHNWRLSCSAGLSVLVSSGRGSDAVEIFKAMDQSALSPDSYIAIAQFFLKDKNWRELGDLYRSAQKHGYMSEELSLVAMTAVVSSKVDGKLRILRTIVDDNARIIGMESDAWIRTRYWHIKQALGFRYASLLMWWNDPETSHLDELELAVKEFEDNRSIGAKAKHDVIQTIVTYAKSFEEELLPSEDIKRRHVPFTRSGWISILEETTLETESLPIRHDPAFIDDVVEAYRNLGCNQQCIDFMSDILECQVRTNRKALIETLCAAREERSAEMAHDLQMLIADT